MGGREYLLARKTIDAIHLERCSYSSISGSPSSHIPEKLLNDMITEREFGHTFPRGDNLSRSIRHGDTLNGGSPHPADYCVIMIIKRTRLDADRYLTRFRR